MPDFSLDAVLGYLISGGLFAGLWEVVRTISEGKNRVHEKEAYDKSDLSRLLLEQNHEGDMMVRQNLIEQIQGARSEIKDLQTKVDAMFEQAVEQEKIVARQEVTIEAQRREIERLQEENRQLRQAKEAGTVEVHTQTVNIKNDQDQP